MENKTKAEVEDVLKTIEEKSKTYGDTTIKVEMAIKVFFPNGVKPEQFDDFNITYRLLEKIARATNDNITLESKIDAYKDILGYALIGFEKYNNNNNS